MPPREFRHALEDILEAINGITEATSDKTIEDYAGSWLLRHGVQRGIEIVSEASRALPPEVTALEPAIPWARIRAVGNVLRHEYHRLSDQLIWGIVRDELPALRAAILRLLG